MYEKANLNVQNYSKEVKMNVIFLSCSLTVAAICVDILFNQKKSFMKYFTLLLLVMGTLYTMRAHATEMFPVELMINPGDEDYIKPEWSIARKCREHGYYMHKYYHEAEKKTWFLPEYDDIEKAKTCFSTAVATAVPPHNITKVIAIAIGLFTKYGLDCIDRYQEVSHLLNRSIYHADMYLFYLDMLPDDCVLPRGYIVIHNHVDEEDYHD